MSVYAVSDLHGCWERWNDIHNFLKEDDTLYILGDCIDRHEGGLTIITEALADPRCIVLCGNHEDMMLRALEYEIKNQESDYWVWRWFQNGGEDTFNEWKAAGGDFGWIDRLKQLPLYAKYVNTEGDTIIMTHSGATPKHNWSIESLSRETLLWDRRHLQDIRWHRHDNEFVVHGHTPIPVMPFYKNKDVVIEPGALCYCDGHKINLDTGGVWTGYFCVLDLDTFEEHIF